REGLGLWLLRADGRAEAICAANPRMDVRPGPLFMWIKGQANPNLVKNETGKIVYWNTSNNGRIKFLICNYLQLHPGHKGEYSVARWVSRANQKCIISATFKSLREGGDPTTTDVRILHNGADISSGYVETNTDVFDVPSMPVALRTGDKIDFVVGYGRNKV